MRKDVQIQYQLFKNWQFCKSKFNNKTSSKKKASQNQLAKKLHQTYLLLFDGRRKQKKKCDINGYKETEQVTCLVDISVLATIIKPKI